MDDSRWSRVQEIFAAALEREGPAREALLRDACGHDTELLEEVRSLLEADTDGHSLLDAGAAGVAQDLGIVEAASHAGERIGPWKLVERIGQGGMGAVYRAERADGEFEQRAALKIIKRGMDSEEILTRFRAERQILARLEHPNIARFLDGGLTDDGVPWFTMEYVDGDPIDRYCDERSLSVDERLELFATVCGAVAYAQRSLVVHRDLKPSNILVAPDGTPKLLDFGIAKLLDAGEGAPAPAQPAVTRTGHRIMTPGYAAPEQVRGEAVTTATDVYALGIILYELLTGQRPYAPADETPGALERAICDTNPQKPSAAVSRPGGGTTSPATTSSARRARPAQLRRKLAGDLDNICLMALRKEPARRYGSVQHLAEDVERYRGGHPVSARPDTVGYRLQKFVRRNRAGVVTAAVFVGLVIGLVAFYTHRLAGERDRARLEAEKSKSVSDFLTGLFEVADPSESLGETITARELLGRGAERLDVELADQPEVQATLLDVVGRVYHNLGLYADADSLLTRALAVRRGLHPGDHADLASSLEHVGGLRRTLGEFEDAEKLLRGALEMRIRLHGREHEATAESLYELSWMLGEAGRLAEAKPLLEESIATFTKLRGERDRSTLVAMADLALLLNEDGDHLGSEALFRRVVPLQREVLGAHPDLSSTLFNFSEQLRTQDHLVEAESVLEEALEIDRKVFGEDHPNVDYDLISLARLKKERHDLDGAEAIFRDVLDSRRRTFGEEHPQVARSLADIAGIRHSRGDYDGAERLYRESLEMHLRVDGDRHPIVSSRYRDLGRLAEARADFDAAVGWHEKATEIRREIWGDGHPRVAETDMYLARALAERGDVERAERIQRAALAATIAARGESHRETLFQKHTLANVLTRAGQTEEAERLYRATIAARDDLYGEEHPSVSAARHDLAVLLRDTGRAAEAETILRRVVAARTKSHAPRSRRAGDSLVELGRILADLGRPEEAVPALQDGLEILRETLPEEHPAVAAAARALASARGQLQ